MKVQTIKAKFTPVTIVIESRREFEVFLDMVGEALYDKCMKSHREYFSQVTTDLYQKLSNSSPVDEGGC